MLTGVKEFFEFGKRKSLKAFLDAVIPCNTYKEIMRLWHWNNTPDISYLGKLPLEYCYPEDINDRALHDAEALMTVCCNAVRDAVLEIGTSTGLTTLGFALNAPQATVYTVDIPQEEAKDGKGGKLITHIIDPDTVGCHYRNAGVRNVQQIFANTATWKPALPQLDMAFIDGCHDRKFVVMDTLKILPFLRQGGFLVWHDANPELIRHHFWIQEVCAAIGDLLGSGAIAGPLYHIRDSWTVIYKKS